MKSPWIGLAAGAVCLGGSLAFARGSATNQSVEVAVWGTDASLQVADVFALLPDGTEVHGALQPSGTFKLDGLTPKSMLFIEPELLGAVSREITLPSIPLTMIDVMYVAHDDAEFLMDLGSNAKRMANSSPFAVKAPINDLPTGAPHIGSQSLSTGSTLGATVDVGVPEGGVPITSPGVWYVVEGTGTTMSASTCGSSSDFDTKLSVYCTGPVPTLIAGNDDGAGCELQSAVSWCSEAGESYLILVHGFGGQVGRFQLSVDAGIEPCTGEILCSSAAEGIYGACCLPTQECADDYTEQECCDARGIWQGAGSKCDGEEGTFDGYEVTECDSHFEDITFVGHDGPHGDDEFEEVPIGFSFTFFGNSYSDIKFSTNGFLTFGDEATAGDNDSCQQATGLNDYIAPFWDDLFVLLPIQTKYATIGTPGTRRFIAQWSLVTESFQTLSLATFQAVLHEESHCIEFRYHLLHNVPSYEGDVTVGIENADGSMGYCVPDTNLDSGVCIRFCPIYTPPTPDIECPCVTIDFQTDDTFGCELENGEQVWPNVNGLFGNLLKFEVWGAGVAGGAIFDTDPWGPNQGPHDRDLLVDTGNALICQSSDYPQQTVAGIFDDPNDSSTGGNIDICFLDYDGVAPQSIDLIDIDNHDSSVPLQLVMWDNCGNCRFYSVPAGFTEDIEHDGPPGFRTLHLNTTISQPGYTATATALDCEGWFDQEHVVRIEINANGSFAIDNLNFCRHLDDCDDPVPTGN